MIIVWAIIGVCHTQFRHALAAHGEELAALRFWAALYPYSTDYYSQRMSS